MLLAHDISDKPLRLIGGVLVHIGEMPRAHQGRRRTRKSRFSDEQIIAVLREQEAGRPTAEVCRKHGISGATFYEWKAKLGSEAKRLKALEDENRKLKKLLTEQVMERSPRGEPP